MKTKQSGFTLIEATLAIIVGVVVIAAAIAIYTQTMLSAANAKANDKVWALQAVVEELTAKRAGAYPTVEEVYGMWIKRREDHAQSPWGGDAGPGFLTFKKPGFDGEDNYPGPPVWEKITQEPAAGCVRFLTYPNATASVWDQAANDYVTIYGYAVAAVGPGGEGYWFVKGGSY